MDQYPKVVIGGPKLLNPDGSITLLQDISDTPHCLFRGTPLEKLFRTPGCKKHLLADWDHNTIRPVDWMLGACHIIRRELLTEIGKLNEGFFYLYEDVEFCWRARKRGWDILYIPESKVTHIYQRQSAAGFNRMTVKHIKSIIRFLKVRYLGY
jgi:GT2 family glycosyltransferase